MIPSKKRNVYIIHLFALFEKKKNIIDVAKSTFIYLF
jgi:hypothetical protein